MRECLSVDVFEKANCLSVITNLIAIIIGNVETKAKHHF